MSEKLIDLHTHSTCSDGSMSPTELAKHAAENSLAAIALTDHDTVSGVEEAVSAGESCGVEVVPAIEFSVKSKTETHILGYFIDIHNPYLKEILGEIIEKRIERNVMTAKLLEDLGFDVTLEEASALAPGGIVGRAHFARVMMNKGYVGSVKEAFDKYLSSGKPAYFGNQKLEAKTAIEAIHSAGGVAFLAHPHLIKISDEQLEEYLEELKSYGLDGLEGFYTDYDEEMQAKFQAMAKRHDLEISGGTDFHAAMKPHISIGKGTGNMAIPYSVLERIKIIRQKYISEVIIMKDYILHLENAADKWENCTPLGNGSMGLSVFGRTDSELFVLNEETVWDEPTEMKPAGDFKEKIAYIRSLFLEGKNFEAAKWAEENLENDFNVIASFEVAGRLNVEFDDKSKAKNYRRDLNLNKGIATVSYTKKNVETVEECFVSYEEKLMVIKFSFSAPSSFSITYDRDLVTEKTAVGNKLVACCDTAHKTHAFCVAAKVDTDGEVIAKKDSLRVESATQAVIYINIVSDNIDKNYRTACVEKMSRDFDCEAIKAEHIKSFSSIMERSDVCFEADEALENLPVDKRLERLKKDDKATDFGLISLYWQFGKYLLVGSSRPGSLPANLQGVWGERMQNPWNADYHTNINLQMNYWQAEQANISECTKPLFDYMNTNLLVGGRKAAQDYYGCSGTVTHHLSDIYGFNGPADGVWGLWPVGGAWLAFHMWEHFLYTRDLVFLKNEAYEYIKACVDFFLDYMVEDSQGRLLTGPSASPENEYIGADGKPVTMCMAPTMDNQIVSGLFEFYLETEKLLGMETETAEKVKAALPKIPPMQVGKYGRLMEWIEDYEDADPGHRHISHAFGLYPAAQITRNTPELYSGIRVTIERRLANGGGHTGWSRAWLINLFARLRDGNEAYNHIRLLFTRSTLPNLFDTHPPFQIDGNFGGAAGIGEMLMQSHEGVISLLPATASFLSGSFTGLKARGDVEVSAGFKEGRVTACTLVSKSAQTVRVEINGEIRECTLEADKEYVISA